MVWVFVCDHATIPYNYMHGVLSMPHERPYKGTYPHKLDQSIPEKKWCTRSKQTNPPRVLCVVSTIDAGSTNFGAVMFIYTLYTAAGTFWCCWPILFFRFNGVFWMPDWSYTPARFPKTAAHRFFIYPVPISTFITGVRVPRSGVRNNGKPLY